ncbi:MAG: hypothetical protein HYZ51_00585 [Candidatus Doudnabacteria bacterium]|nr:hypothetical protein [Candidatus Doudnabacteria bacterium]
MSQEIIDYIKEAFGHGLHELEIKKNLLDAGWEAQMVEASLAHYKAQIRALPRNVDEDIKKIPPEAQNRPQSPVQTTSPQTNLNENRLNSQSLVQTPWYKRTATLIIPVIVLILAGGAFAFYTFVYASPSRVWKKFVESGHDKVLNSEFKFSYADNSPVANEDLTNFPFKNIKLELSGKAYVDTTDGENPQSSTEASYTFSSGTTAFTMGFEYKLIGKKFYLNVGNNPFLSNILTFMSKGKQIEWVVLDLAELEKKGQEEKSEDAEKFKQVFGDELLSEFKKIWEEAEFVKMGNYLGKEKINGKTILHFKNSLDKEVIKTTFHAFADKLVKAVRDTGTEVKNEDADLVKFAISELVEKINLKEFESWVGLTDSKLYKTKIKVSAPSAISAVKAMGLETARSKSRDAKRLADVRQLASALELYFNDREEYPESENGLPIDLTPTYIGLIPTSPLPPDGNCTDYYNIYWYEVKNNGASYELTFCLGQATGGYSEGISKLTPAGISKVEDCPSTPENCYKNGKDQETVDTPQEKSPQEEIKEAINKINFDAEISLEVNYSDYGVKKDIKAPENAFDLMELIESKSPMAEPAM